jgi:hypothetical protein
MPVRKAIVVAGVCSPGALNGVLRFNEHRSKIGTTNHQEILLLPLPMPAMLTPWKRHTPQNKADNGALSFNIRGRLTYATRCRH